MVCLSGSLKKTYSTLMKLKFQQLKPGPAIREKIVIDARTDIHVEYLLGRISCITISFMKPSFDYSCWPCGVCLLYDELYGSESISQVYAIILEFLATLEKADKEKIEYILYGN